MIAQRHFPDFVDAVLWTRVVLNVHSLKTGTGFHPVLKGL